MTAGCLLTLLSIWLADRLRLIAAGFTLDFCSVGCESVHVQIYTQYIKYLLKAYPHLWVSMSRELGSVCIGGEEGREREGFGLSRKEMKQHASIF